ncbi:MAG: AMP-binding protein, partial [Alphaproteobacteria bacterium]
MYYPGAHALSHPDQAAVIVANTRERAEQRISYKTLNDRSNQIAQYLHGNGFRPGDTVAIFMENNIRYFEIVWAVLRSGLVITPINRYLTVAEAAYIINDCGAKALFTFVYMADIAGKLISHI